MKNSKKRMENSNDNDEEDSDEYGSESDES
jgi:hypothetical protein